ncbi:AraC family transcriptional regulator [Vibrio neptunius]|uniref:AraC family transcriptional regulator n=1 Tax=Vibrio neptunius TaxID=170651 RepID=UPI0005FA5955|nr:helix-turn-helix domain-containing protein [Vibrio neptunius]KJY93165.1 AraC family transcriptional regulator [Vibrio neptunius]
MDFEIVNPDGLLADHIQAIWSAKVSVGQAISKPLYCDGGSGVMFVLKGQVSLEGRAYSQSAVYHPYSIVTKNITMSCEAELCGVRFHPGMQFSFLDELIEASKVNRQDGFCFEPSKALVTQLSEQQNHSKRIALLMNWCSEYVSQHDVDEDRAKLIHLAQDGKIGESFGESQRQVERKFKHWVGMSPKYFQRLRRVHASIQNLRDNPQLSLAELAAYQGFSDQAHMTREFKNFVLITPGQFSRRLKQK